jgi:hypothetical protein
MRWSASVFHQPLHLSAFETLERFKDSISKALKGPAYALHLVLPHSDYLFCQECTIRDPSK